MHNYFIEGFCQPGQWASVKSYSADVLSNTDYYAFGQAMPGRTWQGSADRYRYDFNGKESDKEVYNGFQNYGFRMYDCRIGRFFSLDPLSKSFPWYAPYQFAGNSPVVNIDLDGLEDVSVHKLKDKTTQIIAVYNIDDIKLVKIDETPSKRITYYFEENGTPKYTKDQFDGPGKTAEEKLFEAIKNHMNIDAKNGKSNVVTGKGKLPAPSPPPVIHKGRTTVHTDAKKEAEPEKKQSLMQSLIFT